LSARCETDCGWIRQWYSLQVRDRPGLFGGPQRQVVILAAVVAGTDPADPVDQRPAIDRQVAQVHLPTQSLRGELRLGESRPELPVGVQLILVGVQHVDLRVGCDRIAHPLDGGRCQQIVVIQQRHEFAGGQLQCGCGRRDDAGVDRQACHHDPLVAGAEFGHCRGQVGIAGPVVEQDQLPPRIGLGLHGSDHLGQVVQRCAVDRHQQRECQRPGPPR
jgi:hypothetical protein